MDRKMRVVVLDTWELSGSKELQRTQHIGLWREKESEKIYKTRYSLTIPFLHLVRREPEGPHNKDIFLDEDAWKAL